MGNHKICYWFFCGYCFFAMGLPIGFGQGNMASLRLDIGHSRVLPHSPKFDLVGDIKNGKSIVLGANFYPKSRIYAQKNRILAGLNLLYFDAGNEVLGKGMGFYGSLQGRVFQLHRFETDFHFGMGGIYMSCVSDSISNPRNLVNETHFNSYFSAKLRAKYPIAKSWSATISAALTHYSNGAFRLPNLGVNSLVTGVGIEYFFKNQAEQPLYPAVGFLPQNENPRKWFGSLKTGVGQYQHKKTENAKFWVWNLSFFGHWEAWPHFALSPGLMFERTNFLKNLREKYPEEVEEQNYRLSLEATMDWFFNHLYLKGGFGYYLLAPDQTIFKDKTYFRLSANYCLKNTRVHKSPTLFVGLGLKSYKNIAQYPELIAGYLF